MSLLARLSSLLRRPFGSGSRRAEPPVAGGAAPARAPRRPAGNATGFDEALREAFRSAPPPEPARLTPRRATLPQPIGGATTLQHGADAHEPSTATGADAPVLGPALREEPRADLMWTFGPRLPADEAVVPGASSGPVSGPLGEMAGAEADARGAGPPEQDDPLRVPENVTATTDDFFDGMLRRIERRP